MADTIIFISSNKVLTFGSCFKYKPDRHGTCFTMNGNKSTVGWHVGFFTKIIIDPLRKPFVVLFAWDPKQDGISRIFIIRVWRSIKSASRVPVVTG